MKMEDEAKENEDLLSRNGGDTHKNKQMAEND